jgi:hypothetical protein
MEARKEDKIDKPERAAAETRGASSPRSGRERLISRLISRLIKVTNMLHDITRKEGGAMCSTL